jgi:hypothetical protein
LGVLHWSIEGDSFSIIYAMFASFLDLEMVIWSMTESMMRESCLQTEPSLCILLQIKATLAKF